MKNIITITLLFFASTVFACDPIIISFCESIADTSVQNKFVFAGILTGVNSQSIDLEIIKDYNNIVSENSIKVWDGTDIYCNGNFSMASGLVGEAGDSIIAVFEKITTIDNPWDVIGDYRIPSSLSYINHVHVNEHMVTGYVVNDPGNYSQQYDFNVFIHHFSTSSGSCEFYYLDQNEVLANSINLFPNPTSGLFEIKGIDRNAEICIYNILGENIYNSANEHIDISLVQPGSYFVVIEMGNRKTIVQKLVKIN